MMAFDFERALHIPCDGVYGLHICFFFGDGKHEAAIFKPTVVMKKDIKLNRTTSHLFILGDLGIWRCYFFFVLVYGKISFNHILLQVGGYIGVGMKWVALLCMMSALGR